MNEPIPNQRCHGPPKLLQVAAILCTTALLMSRADAFSPSFRYASSSSRTTAPTIATIANNNNNNNRAGSSTRTFLYVDPEDSGNTKVTLTPQLKRKEETKEDEAASIQEQPVDEEEEANRQLRMVSSELSLKKFLGQNTKSPTDIPFDVVLGRTLDTLEDITNIARRKPYDYGWITNDELKRLKNKTVVVLGSGWGAHALMKVADTYSINMIVVSPVNHFVFTPMLASAAVGSVEYRSMTEAVRASNPMVQYIEGKATGINVNEKSIEVQMKSLLKDTYEGAPTRQEQAPAPVTINYDALIVAVGTRVKRSNIPGADKHCYYLKTCDDARKLRTAVGESLEYASRPDVLSDSNEIDNAKNQEERRRRVRFCIVGGGPTGVELAGELCDFFKDICHPRKGTFPKLKDDIEVMLVHGGADLVPNFDKNLRLHALESLRKRGVKVSLNTYTTEVGDGYVKLKDKFSGVEEVVPVGITVWAAGIEPVPFAERMLEQLPESARGAGGRINVDKWMRPPMPTEELVGSVMVLGDAAAYVDEANGDPSKQSYLPQTAQVAGQQGAYLARMLNRNYNMTTTPPMLPAQDEDENQATLNAWLRLRGMETASEFNFLNLGMLAYVGGGDALSQIQVGEVPLFAYAGSVGFVLWRSVYLVKQVATRNRILVTFDWVKTALFGRDVTRL